ncbi:MAG: acyltransferase [Bacteroidota bacterium]
MKAKQLTEGSSLFLDLIRAISVQMVVVGHGISFCSIALFMHPPNFPWIQNIAVVIFFILSGYLISNSIFYKLSTDPHYSFKSYFIDRFSRIYSAFIPALFFVLVMDYISKSKSPEIYSYSDAFDGKTFIGNIFMLQDFPFLKYLHIKITSFGSARPLWTLAIEWWIYLWFGVLMINIIKGKKPSWSIMAVFIFLCIVPAYNLFTGRGHGLTLFWLSGVLVGLVYDKYKVIQLSRFAKLGIVIVVIVLAGLRVRMTMEEYDFIFVFLLAGALLMGMELCSKLQINKRTAAIIRIVANYSYTLYLIHYSIYDYLITHYKSAINPNTLFIAGFVISNCIAFAIGYYTETRLTKWVKKKLKERFA